MNPTALQQVLDVRGHMSRSIEFVYSFMSVSLEKYLETRFNSLEGPFTLLDVGCGTGNTLDQMLGFFTQKHGKQFGGVACDLAPQPLLPEHARTPYANLASRVCADAKQLPLANNSVDFGYSVETMQYVDDTLAALAEGYRVLKPGGVFLWVLQQEDIAGNLSWKDIQQNTQTTAFKALYEDNDLILVCKKDGSFNGFPYRMSNSRTLRERRPNYDTTKAPWIEHVCHGYYTKTI